MRILITNDDGVNSPGVIQLEERLKDIAELIVMCPDRNRSGASHSLTLDAPVRVHHINENRMTIEGTPVDCIHLAMTGLLENKPDMIVSGINGGANLGDDVLYSGTVAAAVEGRFFGLPSIAFSLVGKEDYLQVGLENFDSAAQIAVDLIQKSINDPLPPDTLLNVNVPDIPFSDIEGIEITRLGSRKGAQPMTKAWDPRGRTLYWIGPPGPEDEAGPGTDFHALRSGKVAVTPMQVDLTQHTSIDLLSEWVGDLNSK